jgi:NAD(P)-dependent dehydrogenase (short-subunit alcohol dehydrogenase family)
VYSTCGWDNARLRNPADLGVIVTGAGRGIGKRLAMGFANDQAKVGLIARTERELEATKLEIKQSGGEVFSAHADVRVWSEISSAIHNLKRKFHSHNAEIDVLVVAAAIQGPIGPLAEEDPKHWQVVFETNILGVMHAIRAVLPGMIERRHGKIIVVSGGGSDAARPNFSAYATSKTAIVRLVESVAEEVRDFNIQINCFSPGGAYTSMTDEILAAGERAGAKEIERAEKVRVTGGVSADKQIQVAQFLASERSNHISGKLIHVTDDMKRLEQANMTPDVLTLRRLKL